VGQPRAVPSNLIYHAEEQYQTYWFPAYGLLPRWHHARPAHCDKPAGLESITLTYYREHVEHRFIAGIMARLLAAEGVTLEIREVDYDEWHRGRSSVISG
jgi:SgrR family transcriptional regulator